MDLLPAYRSYAKSDVIISFLFNVRYIVVSTPFSLCWSYAASESLPEVLPFYTNDVVRDAGVVEARVSLVTWLSHTSMHLESTQTCNY